MTIPVPPTKRDEYKAYAEYFASDVFDETIVALKATKNEKAHEIAAAMSIRKLFSQNMISGLDVEWTEIAYMNQKIKQLLSINY